jgi:hypothetical protein
MQVETFQNIVSEALWLNWRFDFGRGLQNQAFLKAVFLSRTQPPT